MAHCIHCVYGHSGVDRKDKGFFFFFFFFFLLFVRCVYVDVKLFSFLYAVFIAHYIVFGFCRKNVLLLEACPGKVGLGKLVGSTKKKNKKKKINK